MAVPVKAPPFFSERLSTPNLPSFRSEVALIHNLYDVERAQDIGSFFYFGSLVFVREAAIRAPCSIGRFGLFPAVSCALVEGPLSLTTRPLHHHSSQTFTNASRMTSSAYPEP